MQKTFVFEVDAELESITPICIAGLEKDLAGMKEANEAQDFTFLAQVGHRLKGSCGGYNLYALGEIGEKLEAAALATNQVETQMYIDEFETILSNMEIRYV